MEETTGLNERRARTIVTLALLFESLWVFFSKYLPLDAGLWALQAELIKSHLAGHAPDAWRLIPYPASNIGAPFIAGLLSSFLPGEVVIRLLLAFGGILLRGLAMLALFRALRVRDAAIYFLVPVLAMTGLWYGGALPYLAGETLALWMLVFLLTQNQPRSSAFWIFSFGMVLVSLFNGLVFLLMMIVVIMILREQRRSVHLSQGWLAEPRSVLGVLLPGLLVLALGVIGGEPIFRLSGTRLLPTGLPRLLFLLTPAPNVLEATFRYGDILHALLELLFFVVLLGCFARAYLLAIEEYTWQSRSIRSAGYIVFVLALLSPIFSGIGIETSSAIIFAIVLILAGSYSRGPAVRRTPADRLIYSLVVITAIASISINAFSIYAGGSAASDVLRTARLMASEEPETVAQNEHIPGIRSASRWIRRSRDKPLMLVRFRIPRRFQFIFFRNMICSLIPRHSSHRAEWCEPRSQFWGKPLARLRHSCLGARISMSILRFAFWLFCRWMRIVRTCSAPSTFRYTKMRELRLQKVRRNTASQSEN